MKKQCPIEPLFEELIAQAALAPSSHNTQPWIFDIDHNCIRLHADRTRALPVNDPADRELTISCGCALFNLRAAAAAQDLGLYVVDQPRPDDEDLLAEISSEGAPDSMIAPLAAAIPERRTYRRRFKARNVSSDALSDLTAAADAEGAWLEPLLDDDRREAVTKLVADGDAEQWADPRWRRELAAWMHPRRRGDGLTLPWLAIPAARFVVRTFDMGNGVGARDENLAEASPALAVIGTTGDVKSDWLEAGQALERVLLVCTNMGLQASYLNQPVQVAGLRPKLQDLCRHGGFPQILLRIGYPEDQLPASPRRALAEILQR